jgi:GNAT superfamily N-acetyltransferase
MNISIVKGYLPGCIGRVSELHAIYYSQLVGFGLPFEARVAREMAEFCSRYDEQRDGLWLATMDGRVHGSIAIDGLHAHDEGAHLRWFITSDEIRGKGIGTSLIRSAMDFCRAKGYNHIYLWTITGLDAARHLYEKFGFELVLQELGSQWGKEIVEQRFEYQNDSVSKFGI